jgi:hypothetical protein
VGGGYLNTASGSAATVGGGISNRATNNYATVPGGAGNTAGGQYSFAAGNGAQALHQGSFVWADSQGSSFASTTNDQFLIHAAGGVGIGTNNPQSALHVGGTVTAGNFVGNGAGLTNLNAAQLSGMVSVAQLPSIVLTNNASGVTLSGSFSGDGSGLTASSAEVVARQQGDVNTLNSADQYTDARVAVLATPLSAATNAANPNTLVKRDANGNFAAGTITASFVGNGAGLSNLNVSGGGMTWQTVTGSAQAQPNNGYIANDANQVTITLPTSPNVGDIVRVTGVGAGGWKLAQNTSQTILGGNFGLIGVAWSAHAGSLTWRSVASSADGTKLVAAVSGGQIWTSSDSGNTWTAHAGSLLWTVASSADGTKLVAAADGGQIWTSSDSGNTWTAHASNQSWVSVASSSDGTKLVAVVSSGQIWTSGDSGTNWTAYAGGLGWQSVASSADGTKLVAAVNNGQIWTSSDSGNTWSPHASNQSWWSVASSSDGTKLVAVTWGGQIWTSSANTSTGPTGYLTAAQNSAIELQYIGNGQFLPLSYAGTFSGN